MRKNIYKLVLPAALVASLMVSGCNKTNNNQDITIESDSDSMASASSSSDEDKVSTVTVADYEDEDFDEDYDEQTSTIITLSNKITSSDNVTVSDSIVTITKGGTYILTGSANAQIVVDSEDDELVKLVLNDASITYDEDSPIYIKSAKKTVITLAKNTTNTITDTSTHEESTDKDGANTDAAIYSKDPVTINGEGSLTINCTNANGLTSKDYLVITNGNININAGNNGLKGKDYILIKDCTLVIDSANDAIKSTNSKDTSLGYINIDGGDITITADGDCIQAETDVYINGGTFSLTTADGNYEVKTGNDDFMGGMMGNKGDMQMPSGDMQLPTNENGEIDTSNMPDNMPMPDGGQMQLPTNENGEIDTSNMPQDMQMPNGEQMQLPTNENGEIDTSNMPQDMQMPNGEQMQPPTNESGEIDTSNMPNGESVSNFDPNNQQGNMQMPNDPNNNKNQTELVSSEASSNENSDTTTTTEDESTSQKGIKATCNIVINGGTFTLNTADDAIHSNQTVTINNSPTFTIATGDDGIHADDTLTINNGIINITKCYEGLEACDIVINDGDISIVASDDGINASDGNQTSSTPMMGLNSGTSATLTFNGGNVYVNASGDGLDSNGYIYQNGGTVIVDGPTSDGDAAIDYDREYVITGGSLMAAGSSGMAQSVSDTSTQNAVIVYLSTRYEANTEVSLVDESGNEILSFTPNKSYNCLQFSSSDMKTNSTYKVSIDGTEVENVTITGVTNTAGTATNTMGGGFGGRR